MSNNTLPIATFRDQIVDSVRKNPVTIITAETGAGKSTQVPQFFLEEDWDIVVTQPRRLAARTVAARVAEEFASPLGEVVGFRTAYERQDSEATRCLFVTDGLALVRELMGNGPQILVIDEVHEWNLNIEVLVAWAKHQIEQGVDFKVVLMSATLEADRLSAYFGGAPVIAVPGRTFPVEEQVMTGQKPEDDVVKLLRQGRNVLVFHPGKREIGETISYLQRMTDLNAEILPLHGELTPDEQARCFRTYKRAKCVVSTNVAQTSVTIPDIDAVVDSGLERRIELVDGVEGLYLKAVSLADSKQRQGRAGRTKPGVYIDWCPATDRLEFPKAEILRVRLDQAVLRLAEAGIDMEGLEFFHQPDHDKIHEAKRALVALGCMNTSGKVTQIGRRIAKLPISVKYGRMVVEAERLSVVDDIITIAAIMEQGGITARLCPTHKKSGYRECDCWRRLAIDEVSSDVIAQMRVYKACESMNKDEMREAGVFVKAYFQAKEKRRHLADTLKGKVTEFKSSGRREDILKAVCAGMVDHLYRHSFGQLQNGDGARTLGRESVVEAAEWLVGQPWDLQIQTKRGPRVLLLVKMASKVNPTWLAEVAPQLIEVKKGENPRYDFDQAEVVSTTETWFNGQLIESCEVLDRTHDAASQLRRDGRNLQQWQNWVERPEIALPNPTDESAEIPEIVVCVYGMDVETSTPLVAYGAIAPYGYRYYSSDPWFKVTWTKDQDEANRLREAAVANLSSVRAEAKAAAERERKAAELRAIQELAEPARRQIEALYDEHYYDWSSELRNQLYGRRYLPNTSDEKSVRQWIAEAEVLVTKAKAFLAEVAAEKAVAETKRMALIGEVEGLQRQAADILDQHRDLLTNELDHELVGIEGYEPGYANLEQLQGWVAQALEQIKRAEAVTRQAKSGSVSDDALAMLKNRFSSH